MTTTPDITPDFRALCAELLDELEYQTSYETNAENCAALQDRARAALATPPPEPGKVTAWMYQGEDHFDGMRWRENWKITIDEKLARFESGNKEPIPLFNAHDSTPPPEPPTQEDLRKMFDENDWNYISPETFEDIARTVLQEWG
jgi:hypothetical protein